MPLNLVNPKTIGTTSMTGTGSTVGPTGSKIKIKVGQTSESGRIPLENVTGDGDDPGPVYCEGQAAHGFSLLGWMLGGTVSGLKSQLGSSRGYLELIYATGHKVEGTAVIDGYRIGPISKVKGCVGVAISGRWENVPTETTA